MAEMLVRMLLLGVLAGAVLFLLRLVAARHPEVFRAFIPSEPSEHDAGSMNAAFTWLIILGLLCFGCAG